MVPVGRLYKQITDVHILQNLLVDYSSEISFNAPRRLEQKKDCFPLLFFIIIIIQGADQLCGRAPRRFGTLSVIVFTFRIKPFLRSLPQFRPHCFYNRGTHLLSPVIT